MQIDLFEEPCDFTIRRLLWSDRPALDRYLERWQRHPDRAIRLKVGRYLSCSHQAQYITDPVDELRVLALESSQVALRAVIDAHADPSVVVRKAARQSLAYRSRELVGAPDDLVEDALRTLCFEKRRWWKYWDAKPSRLLRQLDESVQAKVILSWGPAHSTSEALRFHDFCREWGSRLRFRPLSRQNHECGQDCQRRRQLLGDHA